jgi:chromosome segregation ATPase
MAEFQKFRSALNGFNRKDVADYIVFQNNNHNSQMNQMRNEMDELRAELALARQAPARNIKLESELAAANQRIAELESALASVTAQLEQSKSISQASESRVSDELEAYRRAERVERNANRRAAEISTQVSGVLADATARVDETALTFAEKSELLAEMLNDFRNMMLASKATLRDAATAMYAIQPEENDL